MSVPLTEQGEGDLGEHMARAARRVHIGPTLHDIDEPSDLPWLPPVF